MTWKICAEIGIFFLLVYLIARPLGRYLFHVFDGGKIPAPGVPGGLEKLFYRLAMIRPEHGQTWLEYALSLLVFNAIGMIILFVVMLVQRFLPLNPQRFGPVELTLALNTAVSFATNTNWQAYVPETTMSHFTQMAGLAVQNFLSAATGMCAALALVRGLVRKESRAVGNFWVDLVRGTVYVLLPIALIGAVFLVSQGVPQNFRARVPAATLEGGSQAIPQGPVASQESIKALGTNGGGFFNANSSHPYENPNPLSNLIEMLLIVALPAGLLFAFGHYAGDPGQGRSLFNACFALMLASTIFIAHSNIRSNPLLRKEFHSELRWDDGTGGDLEGKETRFGIGQSALFSAVTTSTSCGAVNNAHDSNQPLAGLAELLNMQLGEVVFGGIGSGLYTLLLFVIITVFVAGLMVGRTPEYLGKKIGPGEMQLTVAAVLLPSALILILSAIAVFIPPAVRTVSNPGPHSFSQLLYACTSASQNNGSAFAGLNANTAFWNLALAFCMLAGRFVPIVLVLKLAGNLAEKKTSPASSGTLPTGNLLFTVLLILIIIIIGGLTFFPALAVGPLAEHLLIGGGF